MLKEEPAKSNNANLAMAKATVGGDLKLSTKKFNTYTDTFKKIDRRNSL